MTNRDNIPRCPARRRCRARRRHPDPAQVLARGAPGGRRPHVAAIDELRAEVLKLCAPARIDERTSKTDLAQEAKLADHELRMQRIEANTSTAVATTSAAKDDTATLVRALTGAISPKVVGGFVAIGTLIPDHSRILPRGALMGSPNGNGNGRGYHEKPVMATSHEYDALRRDIKAVRDQQVSDLETLATKIHASREHAGEALERLAGQVLGPPGEHRERERGLDEGRRLGRCGARAHRGRRGVEGDVPPTTRGGA